VSVPVCFAVQYLYLPISACMPSAAYVWCVVAQTHSASSLHKRGSKLCLKVAGGMWNQAMCSAWRGCLHLWSGVAYCCWVRICMQGCCSLVYAPDDLFKYGAVCCYYYC
jgi:hypothetical protein